MHRAKPLAGAKPNTSHPHAQGLRHAFLFNERSGRQVYDCVTGLKATFNGSPVWSSRLHGGALSFDGTCDLSLVAGTSVFSSANSGSNFAEKGAFTIIAGVMQTGSQSGFQTIWANGGNGLYIAGGQPELYASIASTALSVNVPYVISAAAIMGNLAVGSATGEMEYVINGRLSTMTDYTPLPLMTGATIGGHGSERYIGEISFIYLYDRFIGAGSQTASAYNSGNVGRPGLMAEIHADPFAMFHPSRSRQFAAAVAAGGGGGGALPLVNGGLVNCGRTGGRLVR